MKKVLLFVMAIGFSVSLFAQYKSVQHNANVVKTQSTVGIDIPGGKEVNNYVASKSTVADVQVMMTYYDLLTNGATGENKLYYWPSDDALAAVWIWANDAGGGSWPSRGTGYNYSTDGGNTWGALPSQRLETVRTGWGNLQPWGANGECVVAHQSGTAALVFNTRPTKGTGAWTETQLDIPSPASGMLWPRMLTTGVDHQNIHIIALTAPVANGGQIYNGMDGALLYIRSTDGGATWGSWQQLPGMTSAEYLNLSADDYGFANEHGNTVCFVCSGDFHDTFIMKSNDNGDTWTKTIVYDSPYDLVGVTGTSPSRFYTSDGTVSVLIDNNNFAHVTFGLMADSISGSTTYNYWPYTDGLVYWNETMPMLADMDPDALYNSGNLIGWVQDTMIYYNGSLAQYRANSLSSMPTMSIDENNWMLVCWTSPIDFQDGSGFNLRKIFGRVGYILPDGTADWKPEDEIAEIITDINFIFSELAWPSLASNSSTDNFFMEFMADDYAGNYVTSVGNSSYEGQTVISENYVTVSQLDKITLGIPVGVGEKESVSFQVSQNSPNPVDDITSFGISTTKAGNISLTITNMSGQKVMTRDLGNIPAGNFRVGIDCSSFASGVYFYTVTANNGSVTKKMIVK